MSDTAASPYLTCEELGARLGKAEAWVATRCKSRQFPHLRVGKSIRFTAEHVAAIEALLTVAPTQATQAATSWGRKGRSA